MAGCSVQQVRDLEARGVLARAARTASGHRRFTDTHLRDLHAYRDLAAAVGPVAARSLMAGIRHLSAAEAVDRIGACHVRLDRERDQLQQARTALVLISQEEAAELPGTDEDRLSITAVAQALGLRTSTLRFWEQEGLLHPDHIRSGSGTARAYPLPQIHRARIIVALRAAGHGIPAVREALTAIDAFEVQPSLEFLDRRDELLTRRWMGLLRAGVTLVDIVSPEPALRGD